MVVEFWKEEGSMCRKISALKYGMTNAWEGRDVSIHPWEGSFKSNNEKLVGL